MSLKREAFKFAIKELARFSGASKTLFGQYSLQLKRLPRSYCLPLVLGIFKGHALYIIVVCQWVLSLTLMYIVQVLGIRYFKGHALHIIVVYKWVLSLMYKY